LIDRSQRTARKLNKNSPRNLYLGVKGLWSGTVLYVLEQHNMDCNGTEVFYCRFTEVPLSSGRHSCMVRLWISEDAFRGERVH